MFQRTSANDLCALITMGPYRPETDIGLAQATQVQRMNALRRRACVHVVQMLLQQRNDTRVLQFIGYKMQWFHDGLFYIDLK